MLNLLSGTTRNCEGVSRRSLLQVGALAGLGISLPGLLKQRALAAAGGRSPKETNCIFIWTQGGTSHHDTLDPKPLASEGVRGSLGVIDTAVPGVQFTEVCPQMAMPLQVATASRLARSPPDIRLAPRTERSALVSHQARR